MEHETFFTLLKDKAHWEFELFLMALFDGLIGWVIWPHIKQFLVHHEKDDDKITQLEKDVEELKKKIK